MAHSSSTTIYHKPMHAYMHAMQAVCSLPLNGGSYNILLNATTKGLAAVCACLSVLSYLATGVVSAVRV